MQLKKIELLNYRQYIKQTVEFSIDHDKNVTLIMGDGGSGKTTLSQAFTWVLYSKDDFSNKILLNSKACQELDIGAMKETRVTLYLTHGRNEYIISRNMIYTKTTHGNIRENGNSVVKMYEIINGNQVPLSDIQRHARIREIMPEELSRYFFFDGEKIEKMSKEIERGKSIEFSNAVQGLLGLSALQNAKRHLDVDKTGSVYGFYDKKIEETSDLQVKELGSIIANDTNRILDIDKNISDMESNIVGYKDKIDSVNNSLTQFKETEELQRKYRILEQQLNNAINKKSVKTGSFLDNLHTTNTIDYCSKTLMLDALNELKDGNKIDKGIPDIQARTIDYLIKHKKCICGHCIEKGESEYETLIDLKNYIPPKSVGGLIHDLTNELEAKVKATKYYFDNMKGYMQDIRNEEIVIHDSENNIALLDKDILNSPDEMIRELKNRQSEYKTKVNQLENSIRNAIEEKGRLKEKINRNKTQKDNLIIKTNSNQKYSILREYANALYNKICNSYNVQEKDMRVKFENTINKMFKEIYGVGMNLEIDENYNISVQVDEIEEGDNNLDHSTSQNYSVIFAFIASIMKLNKEKKTGFADIEEENIKENYPLVMDAPLSAFDKSRISNLCTILPNIAEQVIVFIKDTDGDIAREYLKDRIGKAYRIQMNGLINSKIVPEVL